MSLGSQFFKQNFHFCFMPTVRNLLCLSMFFKMFVRWVRTICPPSFIISLVIPPIAWDLCLFILFIALSTSSSVKSDISSVSGLDFIVLSCMGTVLGIE